MAEKYQVIKKKKNPTETLLAVPVPSLYVGRQTVGGGVMPAPLASEVGKGHACSWAAQLSLPAGYMGNVTEACHGVPGPRDSHSAGLGCGQGLCVSSELPVTLKQLVLRAQAGGLVTWKAVAGPICRLCLGFLGQVDIAVGTMVFRCSGSRTGQV